MVNINYLSDGHVHTKLCHHAFGEMEEYVHAAIGQGLTHLVFLEHFEIGVSYFEVTWLTQEDFAYYRREGQRLQVKYRSKIAIELGVEVGFNPEYIACTNTFIKENDWARVGLSYHFMPVVGEHHINMLSRQHANLERIERYGHLKMLDEYYAGLLKAVQTINADVVCHLDAGLRNSKNVVYEDRHWQQIAKILDVILERKMALEINTSGFALRGEPFPRQQILKMAQDRNLPIVLGSDAHKPEQVGRGFELVGALLK